MPQNTSPLKLADAIWSITETLRGDLDHPDLVQSILPFTLLRRLECALERTREVVRQTYLGRTTETFRATPILRQITGLPVYNTSGHTLATLGGANARQNLLDYLAHFSDNAQSMFNQFDFPNTVLRLDEADLLGKVCTHFSAIDLRPSAVSHQEMGHIYEQLIHRLADESSEGADDCVMPVDVAHLAADLVSGADDTLRDATLELMRSVHELHYRGYSDAVAGMLLLTLQDDPDRVRPWPIKEVPMDLIMRLVNALPAPEHGGGRSTMVLPTFSLMAGGVRSPESEIRGYLLESDLVDAIIALPAAIFPISGPRSSLWILSNKKPEHRRGKVQLIDATSLCTVTQVDGQQRCLISDAQRATILGLYADSLDSNSSRMVDYRTFGYRQIRVLHPLHKLLHFDEAGMNRLRNDLAWAKLSSDQQDYWTTGLSVLMGSAKSYDFVEHVAHMYADSCVGAGRVSKGFLKALLEAFGLRDEEGALLGRLGRGFAVSYENVPLAQDVEEYMDLQIHPEVQDARLDRDYRDAKDGHIGRVGYAINFNRFFGPRAGAGAA